MAERPDRDHVYVRLDAELHARLRAAAAERGVSRNLLIERACEDFLERLIPVAELHLTRPPSEEDQP